MTLKVSLVFAIILAFFLIGCYGFERKLKWSRNPGCSKPQCSELIMMHVTAEGPNDTLHHVWSFAGRPALLLALTELNVNLTVDWDRLLFENDPSKSVYFSKDPNYSFGIVLNRVLEFRDRNDTGSLNGVPDKDILSMSTENFYWQEMAIKPATDGSNFNLLVTSTEFETNDTIRYGNISISVTAYARQGYGSKLPHLLHTANCSQFEITLQNMDTESRFEGHSRFAFELLLASSELPQGQGFSLEEHRSLDDEHTPGVFNVIDLMTPETLGGGLGGFVQWRPVAYTGPNRQIESSTEVKYYDLRNNSVWNNTFLFAFYGYELPNLLTEALNVSFGVAEDGYYNASNYVTWSLSMGYGQPPAEKLSLLVLLVLGIGLGIPVVLVVVGGFYMLLCRRKRPKDDLLLGQ